MNIRNLSCWLFAVILISLGLTRRVRKRAKNGEFILSVFFHNPNRELFEFCIKWLLKNKFVFLTQDDVIYYSQQGNQLPNNAVIITVDDGWRGNVENIVKVAAKYSIPVTIFISTEPIQNGIYWWSYIDAGNKSGLINKNVEFYKTLPNDLRLIELKAIKSKVVLKREAMTANQVKEIAKYDCITIGAHTLNHPILTKCDNKELYDELYDSKILLEKWINKPVNSFAYPNGSYGSREVELLKQLNYNIAYTTSAVYLDESALKNVLELPRFFVLDDISQAEALCRMLGVWQVFFH